MKGMIGGRAALGTASLLYAASSVCAWAYAQALGRLTDSAVTGTLSGFAQLAILAAAFAAGEMATSSLARRENLRYANGQALARADALTANLFTRRTRDFRARERSAVLNLMTQDMETVRLQYDNMLPLLVQHVSLAVCTLAGVALASPLLAPFLLLSAGASLLWNRLMQGTMERSRLRFSDVSARSLACLRETAEGMAEIHANRCEAGWRRRAEAGIAARCAARRQDETAQALSFFGGSYASALMRIPLCVAGVWLVGRGEMTPGAVLTAFQLSNRFDSAVSSALEGIFTRRAARAVLRGIEDELCVPTQPPALPLPAEAAGSLAFRGVTFGYGERPLFERLSFDVPAGACVAIVGESGCGKSTVIRLLRGLEEPQAGDVFVDGYDVRTLTEAQLAGRMGVAGQFPVLFTGTLRENICMGAAQWESDAAYWALLRAARLEETAARVGERDVSQGLSGGEARRVAIARALAGGAKILLLDEPESGLDSQNAALVRETIASLSGVTRLVVTHAADDLADYDGVIRIEAKEKQA